MPQEQRRLDAPSRRGFECQLVLAFIVYIDQHHLNGRRSKSEAVLKEIADVSDVRVNVQPRLSKKPGYQLEQSWRDWPLQARRMLASSDGQSSESATLAEVRELRAELRGAVPQSESGSGAFDQSTMEALLRRTDALEYRLGQELGADFRFDTRHSRAAYAERGTDAANNQALAELISDRLAARAVVAIAHRVILIVVLMIVFGGIERLFQAVRPAPLVA